MGQPAARRSDLVVGLDTHLVIVPGVPSPTTVPLPHPFTGSITEDTSDDVFIASLPAATQGSVAENQPSHTPMPPGTSFSSPPSNRGTVDSGSATVTINGQPAARLGDRVRTCNDPTDLPVSTITSGATTVTIG